MSASSKISRSLKWTTMVSLLLGAALLPPTFAEEAKETQAGSPEPAVLTSVAEAPAPEPKADSPKQIVEPRPPVLWVPETDTAKKADSASQPDAAREADSAREATAAAQATDAANETDAAKQTDATKPAAPPSPTESAKPSTEPVSAAPPALEGPAAWHRAKMRLSGSLCTTCMITLEKKIRSIAGVNLVKVDRPGAVYRQSMSPDVMSWAQGIIIYDGRQTNIDGIRTVIKEAGYHPYHIENRPLDHEPVARDVKF